MSFLNKIKNMLSVEEGYETNRGPEYLEQEKPDMVENFDQKESVAEFKVVRPDSFADVTEIADYLLNNCTVVLNLEATNKDVAKRTIDFLAGVAYSINGQLKNIASNIYVITSCNVDVDDAKNLNTDPSANTLF